MLRNAARAVDLPVQLQKAKESLAVVEKQLKSVKREALKRIVQTGVSSCQQDIQTIQKLERDYMNYWNDVEELQKQQNTHGSKGSSRVWTWVWLCS